MYLITIMRSAYKDENSLVPQRESGTWCDDYHIYEEKDGVSIELIRFRGGHGITEDVLQINRKHTGAYIMNINGKTIRSFPLF